MELDTRYDPSKEDEIYKLWEDSGYFDPDNCIKDGICKKDAEPFCIVLPPPNVTGTLHMGHATVLAIEDILIRYKRMQGKKTLWLPGTDHAAIATQAKVESMIYKTEKKTRHDFTREEFLSRVEQFAKESHDIIANQARKMGSSLDWGREAYTLDQKRSLAVRTAFKKMFDAGLIYRGFRVVNWDPKLQTTVSDDEIVYEERKAKFYTFRYSKDFPISISTTRPETKVGDTAVAVNPSDERYKEYIGKEYDVTFVGIPLHIKVIADESVDKDFGTGALGVTPAHSMIDWEMAQRHNLPLKQVINEYAKMIDVSDELNGKKASTDAREIIVENLRKEGLLEKEEEITQNVSTAERSKAVIEPLPKLQWFVNVSKKFTVQDSKLEGIKTGDEVTLKELMLKVVETGQIKIVPERFDKIYFNWIENLRDWCISRQILFGHRIPVWYNKENSEELYVGIEAPAEGNWEQDPDTLDTWFSSGLWTFSTLGWPEITDDLKTYHPTNILETGYDILFFWVARMILMTGFILEDIPFHTVYLHGMVRDIQGRKMSKSLGNGIDPLDMTEKYGADAARLSLIIGAAPGNDIKLSEDRVRGYRNFSTKIWNIARFIEMYKDKVGNDEPQFSEEDKKDIAEMEEVKKQITNYIESLELHLAAETLYHYVWHTLADKVLEASKPRLNSEDPTQRTAAFRKLETILFESLKMLHPFMPFVTESIYQKIKPPTSEGLPDLLMVQKWD